MMKTTERARTRMTKETRRGKEKGVETIKARAKESKRQEWNEITVKMRNSFIG